MQSTLAFFLLQATPNAVDAAPEITEVDVNVLQLLMEGGWYIMLPLALMSLIGMYVFFERHSLCGYFTPTQTNTGTKLCTGDDV